MLSGETNIEYGVQIPYSMNEIWKKTPIDLVDNIMRYTGKMRLRNGTFMNQIRKDDVRYVVLQTIPEKIHTYDPISNVHNTIVHFTPGKNNMNKIIVKYEYKYIQHALFKHSMVDGFNACLDWI
jgi:hypothetical protein